LELVDAVTGQVIASSAQVEICVLDDENFIIEELNNHIMMQTRGGTSRRNQNPYLRLEGGVVSVNKIIFKYSPNHMKKSNGVKLRARVVDQPEVIEAVTGPFTVKDKRSSEYYISTFLPLINLIVSQFDQLRFSQKARSGTLHHQRMMYGD